MNELYILNNMMGCAPLKATIRSVVCAQRYRLANTQRLTMANGIEEHAELDGSPCVACPTGKANAETLVPVTNRDQARTVAHMDGRECADCKIEFQPTARNHRRCVSCAKIRKRVLVKEKAKRAAQEA